MVPGTRVRDYIFEKRIGQGGMGEVWQARHALLDRLVAVKIMADNIALDPNFEQRFLREARAMDRLEHPRIVGVREFFSDGGHYYLVMTLLQGRSLEKLIAESRGPLLLPIALQIGIDILKALDFAHQKGVIHRDVKPSNILMDKDGRAYLTDFGIALMVGESRQTKSGAGIGTPHYMSPEQISNPRAIDHRSDEYSMACVTYEMLTGRPPFDDPDSRESDFTVMLKHIQANPLPPTALNPQLPQSLADIVMKALSKNPNDRFAGCGVFCRSLQECMTKFCADGGSDIDRTISGEFSPVQYTARLQPQKPSPQAAPLPPVVAHSVPGPHMPTPAPVPRTSSQPVAPQAPQPSRPQTPPPPPPPPGQPPVVLTPRPATGTPPAIHTPAPHTPPPPPQTWGQTPQTGIPVQKGMPPVPPHTGPTHAPTGSQAVPGRASGPQPAVPAAPMATRPPATGPVASHAPTPQPAHPKATTPGRTGEKPHVAAEEPRRKTGTSEHRPAAVAPAKKFPVALVAGGAVVAVIIVALLVYFLAIGKKAPATESTPQPAVSEAPAAESLLAKAGMKFVKIPAGSFPMGSNNGNDDEKPVHNVSLTKDFYMLATEVTVAQWRQVTGDPLPNARGDALPVEEVSWEDAQRFIQMLNQKSGQTFRLPTEAEWEYAARAGSQNDYPWGSAFDQAYCWFQGNSDGKAQPVGAKKANKWGLFDMSGNVWEWCQDWKSETYYNEAPPKDPKGPATGEFRIIRGGAYDTSETECRATFRAFMSPGTKGGGIGFRIVSDAPVK